MKFTLYADSSHDDKVTVQLTKHEFEDGLEVTQCLGYVEMVLTLVDGRLCVLMTSHNTAAGPDVEFQYGKVSEVHRRRPIRDNPQA